MIFVTVGTTGFSFDRLLKAVDLAVQRSKIKEKLIVQKGSSQYHFLYKNISSYQEISFGKTLTLIKKARVVICHAGPATIYLALKYAKNKPLVVPRRKNYHEHLNDHQSFFTEFIKKDDLVETVFPEKKIVPEIIKYLKNPAKNKKENYSLTGERLNERLIFYTDRLIKKQKNPPLSTFIAVTLSCNSRCKMCDIWKNKTHNFMDPEICKKLPNSLKMVDITGGEPFLHPNLLEIVKNIKNACPKAKILITTNGLLPEKIKYDAKKILAIDNKSALRISLDGWAKTHDMTRGIPGSFQKVLETIRILKKLQVKDLGIIFTLNKKNKGQVKKVLRFCRKERLNFSLNLIFDSPIYFGKGHMNLRPDVFETEKVLKQVRNHFIFSLNFKNWLKAYFYQMLIKYVKFQKRPIKCKAGINFFYLDPSGNLFYCHLKKWKIGNLKEELFSEIWENRNKKYLSKIRKCHDCFMICTAKDNLKNIHFL